MERGFSINKECLVENQYNRSLIAQRTICDAVIKNNSKELTPSFISKGMIHAARNAHSLYTETLKKEKKKENHEKKAKEKAPRHERSIQYIPL